jgi:2-dehydropantoate 2-reductase
MSSLVVRRAKARSLPRIVMDGTNTENGLDPQRKRTGTLHKTLLIGDGRVATHLNFYLNSLGLKCTQWSRKKASELPSLPTLFAQADRALLLLSDSALANFISENNYLENEKTIHCSGALSLAKIDSAHPLMTFGPTLYAPEIYAKIPFVTEARRRPFSQLMPDLKNPSFAIASEKKALYHALCSMSGNFTTLLWEQTISHFENELRLPREVLTPYMTQCFENLKTAHESVLTGPLARGDVKTIVKHLDSLADRPEQNLYYAFVNYYLKQNSHLGELEYEHIRI